MTSRDSRTARAATGPVYEQPLNERMRTFLRLDFLYQQALYHEEREDAWSTRAAVGSLLEILAITARGDARSEVLKRGRRLDETKPGSGLGLSIVSDLAALYRGSLTLDRSPMGGLRAILNLPGDLAP